MNSSNEHGKRTKLLRFLVKDQEFDIIEQKQKRMGAANQQEIAYNGRHDHVCIAKNESRGLPPANHRKYMLQVEKQSIMCYNTGKIRILVLHVAVLVWQEDDFDGCHFANVE